RRRRNQPAARALRRHRRRQPLPELNAARLLCRRTRNRRPRRRKALAANGGCADGLEFHRRAPLADDALSRLRQGLRRWRNLERRSTALVKDHVMDADLLVKAFIALAPVVVLLVVFDRLDTFNLISAREIAFMLLAGGAIAALSFFANWRVMDGFPIGFSAYSRYVAPVIEESL